ncbi:uncharacterized protein [Nicotiana tomentosiformis]|uniref:uncharacterized protein n=1 Tax=Nicotiana tomentosiformis TaxID=4098 RepID=UPI00388C7600
MAKTSKTVPQKEKASSSQPDADKTLVEPRPEECVPGACVLTSDFKIDKGSSVPGRCVPVSRYMCSITEGHLEQIRKDCNWENKEVASMVHREACSRSRAELSRYEADLQRVTEERNTLKLLCGQREEEIRELRAELAKAHQDQTDLTEQVMIILKTHGLDSGLEANIPISQLQQKLEMIGQLCEEVDIIKAETLGWKEGMDRLAADKEVFRAQLSSAESQLQGIKERSSVQVRKIEELEARLTSELAKAKSEVVKAKVEADAFVDVYRADAESTQVQARKKAETAQTRANWVAELAKCQSRRETLEEIHARGSDLTEEIKKAKELEAEVGNLASDDDHDDDESKSGSESEEELDGEEAAPRDNQEP